jgi:4-hydroxy-tetrahydrodipicolinate synthase
VSAEVRARITGPIPSVRTLFRRDGEIDFRAIREHVEFMVEAGSSAVMLTFGDSLYTVLSDAEVADVTRAVVEQVRGRAVVIAADGGWWTGQTARFAAYARAIGADVLMVIPPDFGGASTPDTLADHYGAAAQHIPVMVVTGVFTTRGVDFALATLRKLLERVPGVIAVKDDWCGEFGRKLSLLVHGRWAVVAGGQKQNHLNAHPYGCDAYLSTFRCFRPEVARDYWQAVQSGDVPRAVGIVRDLDMPLFDAILSLPGGFDAGLHAVLELTGRGERWRRSPYYNLTDAEVAALADTLRACGVLSASGG